MKHFAALYTAIDGTTRTNPKVEALAHYLSTAPEPDRLWTVALFSGRRPKRAATTTELRRWAGEIAGLPDWLVEDSYAVVGDLAETLALLLPDSEDGTDGGTLSDWLTRLAALAGQPEDIRRAAVAEAWSHLGGTERFLFNKLITGGFRVGISRKLMTRALARATGQEEAEIALRLMGDWTPATTTWDQLILSNDMDADTARPYPFCLAHGLDMAPQDLGPPDDWHAEWKWDGIRGQLIVRSRQHHLWSRGEELMTDRFPEFAVTSDFLPDGTVIDGEVLAWADNAPLPFADLQKRIGRKTVPKKLLAEAPAMLLAYDLLEDGGQDIRALPFAGRRARLERLTVALPDTVPIRLSPALPFTDWKTLADTRATARDQRAEGLMLKRADSAYATGRKRGDWWKWKLDPLSIDAVMIYAQAGHGRRANLYTDFTFAVRDGEALVPFTKAYSGLTDEEFGQITQWVRQNTLQRFGPVRQVTPTHVFEIAFEGIQASPRHKSGIALRFPRMARWRHDKTVADAGTLDELKALLALYG
ncbi:ATP-dependent DNA ligase [Chachezhania sediminis]|uniref:ATP-dependent DNA ligase n=1 Tax=Chachezhania sediminis TaxID=2599291 RepID=UPI00131B6B44|nr:ATP-dependent DNA ligase [Chachezhania sediminis]